MLKIGEFSKLSKVSVRMLRHYDEIDLLKPIKIDKFSGYRYYSEEQLPIMVRINFLKEMGFGLTAIKDVLNCYEDKYKLESYLRLRHSELMDDFNKTSKRIQMIEKALENLRKDETMQYSVITKVLPERKVASVRRIIPSYKDEGILWNILFEEIGTLNVEVAKPPYIGAVIHDNEHKEEDVDVEIQISVKGEYKDTENIKFKVEPETMVASVTFNGPYEQFGSAYAALATWISKNGYKFAGPLMDIYHRGYYETQNTEEFITEVCCPITK